MTFCNQCHPFWLCSAAADDYVMMWNMEHVISAADNPSKKVHGRLICPVPSGTSTVQYIAFSPDDSLIALSADKVVHIIDIKESKVRAKLEGHTGIVNCAEFCPHYTSTVVSVSDDRTFKVWGISSLNLLYQSTIISASSFISLSMNPLHESFAVGTADGMIRVYDLADGHDFRCLHQLDVNKTVQKRKAASKLWNDRNNTEPETVTISSKTRPRHEYGQEDTGVNSVSEAEVACNIVALSYIHNASAVQPEASRHPGPKVLNRGHEDIVNELLGTVPTLYVGTTGAILQLDATTLEVVDDVSLQDSLLSANGVGAGQKKSLSLAAGVTFARSSAHNDKVWCIVRKLFRNEVDVLSFRNGSSLTSNHGNHGNYGDVSPTSSASFDACVANTWWRRDVDESTPEVIRSSLSVLSSAPLVPDSPLKSELKPKLPAPTNVKSKQSTSLRPVKPGSIDKKGNIVDRQSVTIHAKIKSSGYAHASPKTAMFQPKTKPTLKQPKSLSSASYSSNPLIKEYPISSQPPIFLRGVLDVAERSTAVNSMHFTEKGDRLVLALSNSTASIISCPLKSTSSDDQFALAGHSLPVTCARWSHNGRWMVTSSDDKTAQVWSHGLLDPVMTFTTTNQNLSSGKVCPTNVAFHKAVCFGQFYYMDRFILLTSVNNLYLYKYHLELTKSDIQRYVSNNKYKLVKKFSLENCQQITATSAINSFHSYLVLCAGSDKSLQVFDMNVGANVCSLSDVHTRPTHCIVQNSGSQYTSHSNAVYDLFLTCGVSDGVKLWDLRANRCVRRYDGHINRVHSCTAAFSPCCRYVATGSEDRSVYLYDIRSGSYLHKLTGHSEAVNHVAFHNQYPQLITASLDGKLRWFTDEEIK